MSTGSAYMTIRGLSIDVVYKDIKNLHVAVYPPTGRVRVAAPKSLGNEQVRLAVIRRLPWIKKQRDRLRAAQRQSQREMVSGESHYVWGVRHRLQVVERPGRHAHVEITGNRLLFHVSEDTTAERRRAILDRWHREQL